MEKLHSIIKLHAIALSKSDSNFKFNAENQIFILTTYT